MSLPSKSAFGRALVLSLAWVATVILVASLPGNAATPGSGTISPASPLLTFSGGPFVVANQGSQATDPPPCASNGTDCDHYALHVDFPADYHAAHPYDRVAVSVSWPHVNGVTDFDVYFLDAGGNTVMHAVSEENPERFTFGACPGTYDRTILIVPATPNGQSYTAKVELITGTDRVNCGLPEDADSDFDGVVDVDDHCANTPIGTSVDRQGCPLPLPAPGTPRFFVYMAPQGVAESVGEPSIGCNYKSEQTFTNTNVGGTTNTLPNGGTVLTFGGFATDMYKTTFNDCQSPAEAVWELKPLLGSATPRAAGDPILFTDSLQGRTFVAQLEALTPAGATIDITDNDGNSFTPSDGLPASDIDHETLGAGPYHAPLTGGTPIYPNAVYYASQSVSDARMHRSDDGGVTFGPGTLMYTTADCGGLHGHVKVAADGTVYVPNNACGGTDTLTHNDGQQAVIVSEDNGNTYSVRKVPGSTTKSARDPSVGVATDSKTIYLGMQAANGHPMIAVSHDKGLTWSAPFDVGASVVNGGPVQNMVFAEVVAGDPDRAAFAFFGSESDIGNYADPLFVGNWYLYVSTTYDGGVTWRTENVTPGDPIQRGGICGGGTCRNLLDFFDATIDKEGRVLVMIEDGCVTDACIHGGANDFAAKGGILRQTGGKRMFAAFDPVEPTVPGAPATSGTTNSNNSVATLTWPTPDHGGSAVTGYKVYRQIGSAGTPQLLGTVTAPPFSDTSFDPTADNLYHVTALNAVGEGPFCKNIRPTLPTGSGDVCVPPGITILTDTPGASGDFNGSSTGPGKDLQSFAMAQPLAADAASMKLEFHIFTDPGVDPQPSGSAWHVIWKMPNGSNKGVRMEYNSGTPEFFVYVPGASNGGTTDGRFVDSKIPADPSSSYDAAAGHIKIVAKLSDLGLAPGDTISNFFAAISENGTAAATLVESMGAGGSFTVHDNSYCTPNAAPIASFTAAPATGSPPLLVYFDGSASHDPNAIDSIASYTFAFGDGQQVTQSTPTVFHTYATAGTYRAVLQVVDSRDKPADTPASQVVTVQVPPKTPVPTAPNNRLGGALSGSGLLLLGLASLARRRRKLAA